MPVASINDLSSLGPPIPDWVGRAYVLITVAVFTLVASSTTRPLRLKILSIVLLGGNIYLLLTMPNIMGHIPGLDPLVANFIVAWLMRAVDLFFLRDDRPLVVKKEESHEADEKTRPSGDNPSEGTVRHGKMQQKFVSMSPFRAFDYLVVNHRMIGTPLQARGVQPFDRSRPHWAPSRDEFVAKKMKHLALAYLMLDLLVTQQPAPSPELFSRNQEFFFSRLRDVTAKEVAFRWLTNFNLWASCTTLIEYIYALVAILAVGSGTYEPREFPPLLGDVREWYSVRNHWRYV